MTKDPTPIQQFSSFGKYGTIGLDFAVSVVLGLLGGRWLDSKYDLSPWLTLGGLFLGVAVGINLMVKTVRELNRELERENGSNAPATNTISTQDDDRELHE